MEKRMKNKQSRYLARPTILLVQVVFMLVLPFVALGPALGSDGAKAWLLYGVAALLFLIQLILLILSLVLGWNRTVVLDAVGIAMRFKNEHVLMPWERLSAKDVSGQYGKILKVKFYDDQNNYVVLEGDWGLLPLIEEYCTNDSLKEVVRRIIRRT